VLGAALEYLHDFGGAVLNTRTAPGAGARIILDAGSGGVYEVLLADYREDYARLCGKKGPWPL